MKKIFKALLCCSLLAIITASFAAEGGSVSDAATLGDVAKNISSVFESFGKLLIGGAYVAGFMMAAVGCFKFKQHKDNPTQIPMGTPIAFLLIGIVLVFLPSIINITGHTLTSSPIQGGFGGEGIDQLK